MKKFIAISVFMLAASFSKSDAQHFVASYGIQHQWGVPDYVTHVVYDRYHNYDWVHARRIHQGGGHFVFNVLLQRGNSFIEVDINNHGYSRIVNRYNYYPLGGHICGDFCGYHEYYYDSYYNICHSHVHHGHNHVAYRPRPVTYVYGGYRTYPRYYYNNTTTVIYKEAPVKQYKKHKKTYRHSPQYSRQEPQRTNVRSTAYPSRRTGNVGAPTVRREESSRSRTSVSESRDSRESSEYRRSSDDSRGNGSAQARTRRGN